MEVSDVHVGKQLHCNYTLAGAKPVPPLCYGFGSTSIPGTGFFNGSVLIGSPLNFPIYKTWGAQLMVGRALKTSNPLAAVCPSIFSISNLASLIPPTPRDVLIGTEGKGMVGMTCNTQMINIANASLINIATANLNGVGIFNWAGAKTMTGVEAIVGAKAQAGAEARSSVKTLNGKLVVNGATTINGKLRVNGHASWTSSIVSTRKKFDIEHPVKGKGHRLEHGCLEGPELGVYYRGRLINESVIELPDYWKGLVDSETITVNLTPHGSYQELYVKSIDWGARINVVNNGGGQPDCSYVVYAERKDVDKLVVEYEGTEPRED